MLIPEKLKLNKFRHVEIPAGRSYFSRYGYGVAPDSAYSGDDMPAPVGESKVEQFARLAPEYDKMMEEVDCAKTEQK